ncbi:hypothetical protein FPRO04_14598, partial [Fusarium proliferatum]
EGTTADEESTNDAPCSTIAPPEQLLSEAGSSGPYGPNGRWIAAEALCQVFSSNGSIEGPFHDAARFMNGANEPPPELSDPPSGIIRILNSIGIDNDTANQILVHFINQTARDHGPYGIVNEMQLDAAVVMRSLQGEHVPQCPLELSLALLAIGLELYSHLVHPDIQFQRSMIVDTLRIEFLSRIPPLTWKSAKLSYHQVVALSLASFTWCLDQELADVAGQWNGIAHVLLATLTKTSNAPSSLVPHLQWIVEYQAVVLMFIQGETVVSTPTIAQTAQGLLPHTVFNAASDVVSSPSTAGSPENIKTEYFQLFRPLLKLLHETNQAHESRGGNDASAIRGKLEDYYLDFPSHLLEYSSLTKPYQAEAMIWLHGIFLISYIPALPAKILAEHAMLTTSSFYSAFEHAYLIGEARLQSLWLYALDPRMSALSPATVNFLILSGAVVSLALELFRGDMGGSSRLSQPAVDPPPGLLSVGTALASMLQQLLNVGGRFNLTSLEAVRVRLEELCNGLGAPPGDLTLGVPYGSHTSEADLGPESLPQASGTILLSEDDRSLGCDAIMALCAPEARACRAGCFDLAIQF